MEKKEIVLSVVMAVFNEAENLDRSLKSVVQIADEIIIVDGGSTDKTLEIAAGYGAKIIQTGNPEVFHINKQKALSAARGKWILQLDADEEVPLVLADEINHVIRLSDREIRTRNINSKLSNLFLRHQKLLEKNLPKTNPPTGGQRSNINAFYLPRLNYFLGAPIKYAGTYPDGVIRLVKNGFARFPAQSVHEQIEVDGDTAWLTHDLIHYSNPTLRRYLKGASRYTDLLAKRLRDEQVGKNPVSLINYFLVKPWSTFFLLYLRHKGFLDGWRGLLFCKLSAWHYPVAYWKYLRKAGQK